MKVLQQEPADHEALNLLTASYASARMRGLGHATELRLRRTEIQDYLNVLEDRAGLPDVLYRLASQRLALERLLPPEQTDERAQQLGRAIEVLRELQSLLDADGDAVTRASAAYQLGRALKHQGDFNKANGEPLEAFYREALDAFATALDLDPGRIDALGEIVLVHLARGAPEEALSAVRAHEPRVAAGPAKGKVHSMLGNLLVAAHQSEAAIEAFDRALALDANFMDTYVGLFRLHQQAGQTDAALEVMRRASDADPRFITAYIQSGQLLAGLERWDDAIEAFERVFAIPASEAKVLGMVPSQNVYRNRLYYSAGAWLAWLYLQHAEDTEKALQAAQIATRYQPADPNLLDTIAWSHYRRGEFEQAREILEETVKRAENMASAHYHLAAVLTKLGERDAALRAAERALTLDKPFSERAQAEALVAELRAD